MVSTTNERRVMRRGHDFRALSASTADALNTQRGDDGADVAINGTLTKGLSGKSGRETL